MSQVMRRLVKQNAKFVRILNIQLMVCDAESLYGMRSRKYALNFAAKFFCGNKKESEN
jgi:hypothetical protein